MQVTAPWKVGGDKLLLELLAPESNKLFNFRTWDVRVLKNTFKKKKKKKKLIKLKTVLLYNTA